MTVDIQFSVPEWALLNLVKSDDWEAKFKTLMDQLDAREISFEAEGVRYTLRKDESGKIDLTKEAKCEK